MASSSTTLPLYILLREPETVSISEIIHQLERNGTDTMKTMRAVLHSRYYYDFSWSLEGREAQTVINILDRVSDWRPRLIWAIDSG